ncbi:siroheme synthase CysG [Castellaniella sp. FW104-16D08]|uniref:siroheme synthase CysG n=1 Tax=unclassified Castellaniella TaxID=2617606 RepID=UPI003314B84A
MNLFPLFLDLHDKAVLVIGAGLVAERKIELLSQAGARITVLAPEACAAVRARAQAGQITWHAKAFDPAWLDAVWIVVAATPDPDVNQAVAAAAAARRIWCNVVDDAALSSAQVPAIVDRSPVTVAISSGGAAPIIARRLRERLEALTEPAIGPLAALAQRHRCAIRAAYPDLGARRRFYEELLDGPVMAALRRNRPERAERLLNEALQDQPAVRPGRVLLVGAGPGDAGLLTLRGLRALNEADVILYDRLVSMDVLALARRDAQRILVGKAPGGDHENTQQRIHALLVQHARQGRCVVRLKGGDPLIYGRGGEELKHLRAHGIAYEVVPGITAALACAAYAGIPLTHRDHASTLVLEAAHHRHGAQRNESAAAGRSTRVYYMGVKELPTLSRDLIAQGLKHTTPCALIENGSRTNQRVLHGNLDDIATAAQQQAITSPALLIVGAVAALGRQLSWFGETIASEHRVEAEIYPELEVMAA